LRDSNTQSTRRLRAGLTLLFQSLDPRARPPDALEVIRWTFENDDRIGRFAGPRLEWFAFLVSRSMPGEAEPARLQDECTRIYLSATNRKAEELASASHGYWPH
jgi:hypothetical protein